MNEEDVKKILDKMYHTEYTGSLTYAEYLDDFAGEICQLESKPKRVIKSPPKPRPESMPKPDEGRLLTDKEIMEILNIGFGSPFDAVAKAQRDLTASIKDTEWVERLNGCKDGCRLSMETVRKQKDAECSKEIEEIFQQEISINWEECTVLSNRLNPDDKSEIDEILHLKWQALKDRYKEKK